MTLFSLLNDQQMRNWLGVEHLASLLVPTRWAPASYNINGVITPINGLING